MEPVKEIISNVLAEIQSPEKKSRQNLMELWPSIAGPKIAALTKPALGSNGQLVVWVSDSALAYDLKQKYHGSLLKRAQAALGSEQITSVRFYVGQIR